MTIAANVVAFRYATSTVLLLDFVALLISVSLDAVPFRLDEFRIRKRRASTIQEICVGGTGAVLALKLVGRTSRHAGAVVKEGQSAIAIAAQARRATGPRALEAALMARLAHGRPTKLADIF